MSDVRLLAALLVVLITPVAGAQPLAASLAVGLPHVRSGFTARAAIVSNGNVSTRVGIEALASGNALFVLLLKHNGTAVPSAYREHEEIFAEGIVLEHDARANSPIAVVASLGRYQTARHLGAVRTCLDIGCMFGPDGPMIWKWEPGAGFSIGLSFSQRVGPVRLAVSARHHQITIPSARHFMLLDVGVSSR